MTTRQEQPIGLVQPMRREDIVGVVALAAEESTAPHWPIAEYYRMLDVIAESPGRRGAWALLLGAGEGRLSLASAVRKPRAPVAKEDALASRSPLLLGQTGVGKPASMVQPVVFPVVGFAMASHVAGVCDLEAVVIQTAWRGRRFGAALVGAAAAWGAALHASRLQLEVRASNAAALRLYQRMDFSIDGRRPGYYRNPDEEAVLMSLPLQPEGAGAIA